MLQLATERKAQIRSVGMSQEHWEFLFGTRKFPFLSVRWFRFLTETSREIVIFAFINVVFILFFRVIEGVLSYLISTQSIIQIGIYCIRLLLNNSIRNLARGSLFTDFIMFYFLFTFPIISLLRDTHFFYS